MRIVFDLQGAQTSSRFRGIGKYSLSLCKALLKIGTEHEFRIVLNGLFPESIRHVREELHGLIEQRHILIWEAVGPVASFDRNNNWRNRTARLLYESFIESQTPDFVLVSTFFEGFEEDCVTSIGNFSSAMTAVMSYDFIPLIYPEHYLNSIDKREWYESKLTSLKKADILLAISDSSRAEAITHAGVDPQKIVNISAALDVEPILFRETLKERNTASRLGIEKPFILYTSATDWRKNQNRLIEAFSRLPEHITDSYQLVLAGRLQKVADDEFHRLAKRTGIPENALVTTGHITDTEMYDLYNTCEIFVFPSIHEGFGLPVLEAMSCGKAVVASNNSSIPELLDRQEVLFNPLDPIDISEKLLAVLKDRKLRENLERYNKEKALQFSWARSASLTLEAMSQMVDDAQPPRPAPRPQSVYTQLVKGISTLAPNISESDLVGTAHCISRNHPRNIGPQLLIDISELHRSDARTGIQRVVRSITHQLLLYPPEEFNVEPVYADEHGIYRYSGWHLEHTRSRSNIHLTGEIVEFSNEDIFLGLDLVSGIVYRTESYYDYLKDHGVRVYFVIYDLLPVTLPHYFSGADRVHANWLRVVAKSDGAICISETVASEYAEWIEEEKVKTSRTFNIKYFHLGSDISNSLPSKGLPEEAKDLFRRTDHNLKFLMVGTIEPRKGHTFVLDAFEKLWGRRSDAILIIIGKQGWHTEGLCQRIRNHSQLDTKLFWLEGISDEYLQEAYTQSDAIICGSEGEGFGLPLIEASKYSLPIIARDIPVFHEVAGSHAFYFSSNTPEGLANELDQWIQLYKSNQHPNSGPLPSLTWRESADQLWRAISHVA